MINYITFAGTDLKTQYNLYVNGRSTYTTPTRDLNIVKIPGRSGDLIYENNRFDNIDVTYPECFIYPNANGFNASYSNLRNFLLSRKGYQKLIDTYHPNEYRMAIYKDQIEPDMDMLNSFGSFDLTFHCKPQRFLTSGDNWIEFTSANSINNPTNFASKPLLHVYGYGTLMIGSQSIIISDPSASDYYIDCEMMDAYKIVFGTNISINDKIQLTNYNFPVLNPGSTGISLGSGITKVLIQPRWWIV